MIKKIMPSISGNKTRILRETMIYFEIKLIKNFTGLIPGAGNLKTPLTLINKHNAIYFTSIFFLEWNLREFLPFYRLRKCKITTEKN